MKVCKGGYKFKPLRTYMGSISSGHGNGHKGGMDSDRDGGGGAGR